MIYSKCLVVPEFRARDLERMCREPSSSTRRGVEFDEEVTFIDGLRMAIQVIGCGDREAAWTQGVLFSPDGCELGTTDCRESFLGEYEILHDGNEYSVVVLSVGQLRSGPLWPLWHNDAAQFTRLIGELVAVGGFTAEVVRDLAGEMDLSEEAVVRLIERGQARWDYLKRRLPSGDTDDLKAAEVSRQASEYAGWSTSAMVAAICDFIDECGLTDQLDLYLSAKAGLDLVMEVEGESCGR